MSEAERLFELQSYNILDTDREAVFDDIAHLARSILSSTVSLVCIIDADRQWFKADSGVNELMGDLRETPREISFCAHAIHSDEVLVVEDATQDARFKDNPMVTDFPHVRSYAGAPLVMSPGIRLGSVCVLDQSVRSFTSDELKTLEILRDAAVAHIKLRARDNLEFVAICSWCNKVMNDISSAQSSVRITHGICPECASNLN